MQFVLERRTIRPWHLDDAESLVNHANNRKVRLWLRDLVPHSYTIEDAQEFLQRTTREQPALKFCVELEGTAVGGIGVHPGQDVHRHTATVAYWFGEQFWGRGIMTEAVTAVTDFCFDNFRSAESLRRRLRTIPHPHACWKKPALVSKDACKNNVSKTQKFSICCSTPGKVAPCEPATCMSVDHRRYGSPQQTNDFIYRSRVQR